MLYPGKTDASVAASMKGVETTEVSDLKAVSFMYVGVGCAHNKEEGSRVLKMEGKSA